VLFAGACKRLPASVVVPDPLRVIENKRGTRLGRRGGALYLHAAALRLCFSNRAMMQATSKKKLLLLESPEVYASDAMQSYVLDEAGRPSKQWIQKVLKGQQESDQVKRSDPDFLLLPDTHRTNRGGGADQSWFRTTLNWLCIPRDCSLRSLRDLRGEHVGLLEKMLRESLECIEAETGIPADEVMAYVHYPPSVYHLHVHFAYPYGQQTHRDPFRMHSLASVIQNLRLDGGYYERISLHVPVHADTCLSGILAKQERSWL